MTWLPLSMMDGNYGVARAANGAIEYLAGDDGQRWSSAKRQAARRKAEALNLAGSTGLPDRCTEAELQSWVTGLHLSPAMLGALHLLLVQGCTWKAAAERSGVTESGVLRALRRIASRTAARQQ